MTGLPFALGGLGVLAPEPRVRLEEGAVFGPAGGTHAGIVEPLLAVAWLDETPDARLHDVVEEDLTRMLSRPGALLVDLEGTAIGGVEAVRTFVLELGEGLPATASEQWRLLAGGRRWTVTAVTALPDQPVWGPSLAEIAATFRPG